MTKVDEAIVEMEAALAALEAIHAAAVLQYDSRKALLENDLEDTRLLVADGYPG